MKSLTIRILISLTALLALGALVLVYWAELQFRSHGPERFHRGALNLLADQAEQKWKSEDAPAVRLFLGDLSQRFRSRFQWLDAQGNDLLGDEDHPELINQDYFQRHAHHRFRSGPEGPHPPFLAENGLIAFVTKPTSGQFRLVEWVQLPPPRVPMALFSIIGLTLVLFGGLMTMQVVRPVRKLQSIVDDFGRGNLQARAHLNRSDEIGDLAASFNRMADQIHQLVERERGVVRSVAHEVRGPLTRMSLLMERLRNGKRMDETLQRMENEIKTLSQIPELLLQLSLVESGKADLKWEKCNLGDFLREIMDRMEPIAVGRGCKIQMMTGSDFDLEIEIAPAILGRSIENIIENALRHSPDDSTVDIELKSADGDLELSIRDHGPGVPEADLGSIFRPFFRCDASRTRNTGGLGLGLAITRSCVEAMGGTIWARNAEPGLKLTMRLKRNAGKSMEKMP